MKSLQLTNAWHATSGGIATHYKSLHVEAERSGRQMVMIVPGERYAVERGLTTAIHTVAARHSPLNPAYRTIIPTGCPAYIPAFARSSSMSNQTSSRSATSTPFITSLA